MIAVLVRPTALALALILSFQTGTAHAAPSPRDLAYEQGVHADELGDHALAAGEFARAYRLTPPDETGPRLLFLRASVAASLRARADGDPQGHLCRARALLREHLGAAPASDPDPLADERRSLADIERHLGGADCSPPAPDPPPAPAPTFLNKSEPAFKDISQPVPAPTDPSRAPRALRISGAASLGVGAAALVMMGVGIALARAADRAGRSQCWNVATACVADAGSLQDIVADGRRADQLLRSGAVLGGLGILAGAVLLGLGLRPVRPRPGPTATLRFGPGSAALGLQGRF